MLDVVARVLPYETTDGRMTLAEVAERGEIIYAPTTDEFRSVSTVARAQGVVVVNAGYVYDAELMARLASTGRWRVRPFDPADVMQVLGLPDADRAAFCSPVLAEARRLLAADDCDVILRTFEPSTVPAILMRDADAERRRELDQQRRADPDLWGGLLDSFATTSRTPTRTLVLNDGAAVVHRLVGLGHGEVFNAGVRALYLSAVMLAGEGLRTGEISGLTGALDTLLRAAVPEWGSDTAGRDS